MIRVSAAIILSMSAFILSMSLALSAPLRADEGYWPYNQPPVKQLKEKYQFDPGPDWFEHLQKSSVRFGQFGASASLVSADGLLMTNHHVGEGQIFKLSTPERDLIANGFYAKTRAEELKCPDVELYVLQSIADVTQRVTGAVKAGMSDVDANKARNQEIAAIEQENKAGGLVPEVVTLYRGARYNLYLYKRYTDVRLVFAPEIRAAAFGGDVDNFEFPRYALDCSFFRIYENDQPLRPQHYLHWSQTGANEGDLVFVTGHPARTQRLLTADHLKFLRDVQYPDTIQRLCRREVQLQQFCSRSDENRRLGEQELQGVQNSRKAIMGSLSGLQNPAILNEKIAAEARLRTAVAAKPENQKQWGDAWDRLAAAYKGYRSFQLKYAAVEGRYGGLHSDLFNKARTIVRLAAERGKPNAERLPEYQDARLESLNLRLYSTAPIHAPLEISNLAGGLGNLVETLGGDDPLAAEILQGKSPAERAVELVRGTKLGEISERKKLTAQDSAALAGSTDPMIQLALKLDPLGRSLRKRYEDEVESVERDCYAKIAAAHFAIEGDNVYPDANGALRLSFGIVKGYSDAGAQTPAFTHFSGLYERAQQRGPAEPFDLPKSWVAAKDRLKLDTPYDLVCTADVIGGNSGSPLVNRAGEVVGLIFDGNLQSLIWDFVFTDVTARSVAVDARGLVEALRTVYGAAGLADELTARPSKAAASR